jgi:hypothetical protein
MRPNYTQSKILVKLPPGRFLCQGEVLRKTDCYIFNGVLVVTQWSGCCVNQGNFYYRSFKYKPKYRCLKTGEKLKFNDEMLCNFKPYSWSKIKPWWVNFTIDKTDGNKKIFRRRRHVKSWVE